MHFSDKVRAKKSYFGYGYEKYLRLRHAQLINSLSIANSLELAKKVLKPGDIVTALGCGGIRRTFTFQGFEGAWILGKTIDDVHPIDIYKVNSKWVDFTDVELK